MVAGRAGRVLFHLYCRKKSPAAPTNTARWKPTGFIVYRDTTTYICCTKSLTAVFQRLSVLQNNKWDEDTELGRCSTDTGNAAFCLYTLRCWIYSLLVWTMPISTFGGVLQCKWLTWNQHSAHIFSPSNAPIIRCVPMEGLTLQVHSAAIVSWQGPFTQSLPILALISRSTV